MTKGNTFFIILFIAGFISSQILYAQQSQNGKTGVKRIKPRADLYNTRNESITAADSMNAKFYFLKGIGNKISGNITGAVENFNECLKYDVNNDAAYYELALARFNAQVFPEALLNINRAVLLKPHQIWYLNLQATLYDQKADFVKLAEVYGHMIEIEPDKVNYYIARANSLVSAGDNEGAISTLDLIEKRDGLTEDIEFQKQKIFLKMNQFAKAIQSMQQLINDNPQDPRYYLLLAEIYRTQNQNDLVFKSLQKAIRIDSANGYAQLALSDYYRAIGNKEATFTALKNAFASDDVDTEQKKRLIIDNYVNTQASDQHEGLELARIVSRNNPEDSQAQAIYAGFLAHNPETTREGRDAVQSLIEKNKSNFSLWTNLIISDFNLRVYHDAVKHTAEAISYFPNQVILYLYQGIALNQELKFRAAIESLKTGLTLAEGQADLEAQLYQVLGDAYHGAGENTLSDDSYDKSLNKRPDDAGTLNNYAYYLCVRKKRLDRAEAMSVRANTLEPGNINYEDTLAWIFYSQQEYDKALLVIEKALNNNAGNNATIYDHYGDILYKMGKTAEAVESWKKARAFGSKDLNLSRKIANRKIYE